MDTRKYQRKRSFRRPLVTLLALVMLLSVCFPALVVSAGEVAPSESCTVPVGGQCAYSPELPEGAADVKVAVPEGSGLEVSFAEGKFTVKAAAAQAGSYTVSYTYADAEAKVHTGSFVVKVTEPVSVVSEAPAQADPVEEPPAESTEAPVETTEAPAETTEAPEASEPETETIVPSEQPSQEPAKVGNAISEAVTPQKANESTTGIITEESSAFEVAARASIGTLEMRRNQTNTTLRLSSDPNGTVSYSVSSSANITVTNNRRYLTVRVGSDVATGEYTITCTYSTGWFSSTTDTFTVSVIDSTVTVTFDPNISMGGSGNAYTMQVSAGEPFTFPDPADIGILPQEGYMFAGWDLVSGVPQANKDFSYRPNVQVRDDQIPNDNQTWYATWIPVNGSGTTDAEFYIRLDGVMPYEPSNYAASAYTAGIRISNALRRAIHVNNNTAAVYANLANMPTDEQIRQVVEAAGLSYEGKRVLWYVIKKEATWHVDGVLLDEEKYQVIYHPNGGSANVPPAVQYAEDDNVNVRYDYIPTRNGYTFLGWDENPKAVTPTYTQDGASNNFTMPAKDVNLYAIWQPNNTTPYYIDYYLVEPDGTATLQESATEERTGTTGAKASVQDSDIKSFTNYTYDSDYPGTVLSGIIDADEPLHLKLYYVRSTASLTVKKVFDGITADQYPAEVTINISGNGIDRDLTLNSANQYQATLENLYAGYTYTVKEATTNGITIENYDLVTTYSTSNGQITLSDTDANVVTVTNTYTRKIADVTISKTVDGNMGDHSRRFQFTVTIENGTLAAYDAVNSSGVSYVVNGNTVTFTLAHGESVVLKDVSIGATLTIVETPGGYIAASSSEQTTGDATISVNVSDNTAVSYVNTLQLDTPDTGISLDSVPYIILAMFSIFGVAFVLMKRRAF